ncbi:hypothetical protein HP439_04575 [Sphingobacterium shayense]|uniref:hypothetical protein n=1 Tax=Sphingobacterium shayense TaxID=626343 RepID=UPI0015581E4E|nr:hypothetical protein [Sphingobacterium shayense]NQD69996.1 hypothetical protein [Sphingobacterium shayense]
MNKEVKTPIRQNSNHRNFRTTVNLTKQEYEELLRLQALWECSFPQVYRRILFNTKPVVLNTRITMESLDRLGLALKDSNDTLNRLLEDISTSNNSADTILQERGKITGAVDDCRSRIEECTTAMLGLIKKI